MPTRFVSLLVTPEGFCDEYLAILSTISKKMLDPSVREALLVCKTAAEAIEILEMHPEFPLGRGLPKSYFNRKREAATV